MQGYVLSDERRENRLYDKAFTAMNAPNVFHRSVTEMMEPFQPRSRMPMGAPPVRYPDVNTTGGFLEDPMQDAQDARNVAGRMAERYNARDPMPYQWDGQAVYRQEYQKSTLGEIPSNPVNQGILPKTLPLRDNRVPGQAWGDSTF